MGPGPSVLAAPNPPHLLAFYGQTLWSEPLLHPIFASSVPIFFRILNQTLLFVGFAVRRVLKNE
jgi:hypothetical protein